MAQIDNSRLRPVPRVSSRPQKKAGCKRARRASSCGSAPSAHIRATVRREPTQTRAQATREAVVTAAEQLLVAHGYATTSTNAIARRAGVSVGSLYQYFSDKQAVFRAVVQRHRAEVLPPIRRALEAMADVRQDFLPGVLELMRDMSRINARDAKLMTAIDRELNWLEHEMDSDFEIQPLVRRILCARFAMPKRELIVVAELIVLTVTQLSRWLVHSKPPELDSEAFIGAAGRMLAALLPQTVVNARDTTRGQPREVLPMAFPRR